MLVLCCTIKRHKESFFFFFFFFFCIRESRHNEHVIGWKPSIILNDKLTHQILAFSEEMGSELILKTSNIKRKLKNNYNNRQRERCSFFFVLLITFLLVFLYFQGQETVMEKKSVSLSHSLSCCSLRKPCCTEQPCNELWQSQNFFFICLRGQ